MSDAVIVSLISATGSTIAAILGILNNILAKRNQDHLARVKDAMVSLEKNTNSKMDALVEITKKEAFARGVKEGEANEVGNKL
jgi:predicted ArsR family transcriptional regulator